jgi:prolyl 3-hydroxylase /prolyl 3,4-dihydroxylase
MVLREDLFDKSSGEVQRLKQSYQQGVPYNHCIIPSFCDDAVLREVRREIIENFEATYKETDLFKMLQTVDLANLDTLDEDKKKKIPSLFSLRDAMYSKDFREFVSDVTGCGELSDTTDCACNIHPFGGHLLCHDDVIGDRRVSYIIYLTDPDDGWTEQDGGALELYPQDPEKAMVPYPIPSATVLPMWNTMAMFKVEAGKSFHSIQECMSSEKPRMSLQGWFHGPLPEETSSNALPTLKMLQSCVVGDGGSQFRDFTSVHPTCQLITGDEAPFSLSAEDVEYLAEWINPVYLDGRGTEKIQKKFEEDGSIHLMNILNEQVANAIREEMITVDGQDAVGEGRRPAYDVGMCGGWSLHGPAHMQRYLTFPSEYARDTSSPHNRLGSILSDIYEKLISSVPFANFIRACTTLSMLGCQGEVRRFRPGLDYTVAHYGGLTKDPRLDVVFCFVNDAPMDSWGDGECGGFEAYVLADEEEDGPAEVYRQVQDDDSGVLNVSATFNAVSIVLRDEGLMKFVKYVSAIAPGSRWDISAVMLPYDDSEDED